MQTPTQTPTNRLTLKVERVVNLNALGVNTANTKSGWPCTITIITHV
jgi:hypothetical protein